MILLLTGEEFFQQEGIGGELIGLIVLHQRRQFVAECDFIRHVSCGDVKSEIGSGNWEFEMRG